MGGEYGGVAVTAHKKYIPFEVKLFVLFEEHREAVRVFVFHARQVPSLFPYKRKYRIFSFVAVYISFFIPFTVDTLTSHVSEKKTCILTNVRIHLRFLASCVSEARNDKRLLSFHRHAIDVYENI